MGCFRARQVWFLPVLHLGLGLTSLGLHSVSEQERHDLLHCWVWVWVLKVWACTWCFRARWAKFLPVLHLGSGSYKSGSAQTVSEQNRRDFLHCWVWVWVLHVWICTGCFRARQVWFLPVVTGSWTQQNWNPSSIRRQSWSFLTHPTTLLGRYV